MACLSNHSFHALACRLPVVTCVATCRTIGNVIPIAALSDRHDVVGVEIRSNSPAVHALPVALGQHRLTPQLVGFAAVASGRSAGPGRVVLLWPGGSAQPQRPVARYPSGHTPQLLNITTPVVPVLFVVLDTIFRYSVPNTSSGNA